jgi:DNA-binding winged helix-turn-helix (wHTH) protein/tetratricopeptide (TPR) repeat protein/TolB-like protein
MSARRPLGDNATAAVGPLARPPRLAFGPFIADPETGQLTEGGRLIPLTPLPFETLYYLARRSGHVVSKTELLEELWGGQSVSDGVLVQCVVDIRRALGETPKASHYIQTLPRRGYRFVAPVRSVTGDGAAAPEVRAPARPLRARVAILLGALLAVIVVSGLWLAHRRGASRIEALDAETHPPERGSVLVMPILVRGADAEKAWLRNGLAEMIGAELGQTRGLHVVPRHRLAAALVKAGLDEDAVASGESAGAIARGLRAQWLVTSSYVHLEDRFVLTAQVVDVATSRTGGTAVVRGRHPSDLLDAVDALCLKLLQPLRPAPDPASDSSGRPTGLATRSVEASREYVEALDVWFRIGGWRGAEQAEAHLDRALELDPSFAQAYVKKAEILQWRRQVGYGDPDPRPAIVAAARLVKDLPEREQLLIGSLEALIVHQEPDGALRRWRSLLEIYPAYAQDAGVPSLMLETLMRQGRWEEMIRVGQGQLATTSIPDYQRAMVSSLLAEAFRHKGEFGPALENARNAVELWPSRERPEWLRQRGFLGRISLDGGRRDEAVAEFRAIAAAAAADADNLTQAAWGLYMAGEATEAASNVERALKVDASYGNAYHLLGWIQMAQGDYARAAENLEKAYAKTSPQYGRTYQGHLGGDLAALYYAGVAWQKAGRLERARAALGGVVDHCSRLERHLGEEPGPAARWQAANFLARAKVRLGVAASEPPRLPEDETTYFVQSARLDALQGRREVALRKLAQGLALGFREYRHIQDDADFESLRGEPEFRRLVTEPLARLTSSGPAVRATR